MWYLETGLYLCIQDCIYGFEGRVMAGLWDIYQRCVLPGQQQLRRSSVTRSPLGTSVQTAHVFYVSTEGIRRQQYSRLLHTTLLMSNVMLDRMTSEVTSLWTGSQTEKTNQVILLQFDTTEIVIPE